MILNFWVLIHNKLGSELTPELWLNDKIIMCHDHSIYSNKSQKSPRLSSEYRLLHAQCCICKRPGINWAVWWVYFVGGHRVSSLWARNCICHFLSRRSHCEYLSLISEKSAATRLLGSNRCDSEREKMCTSLIYFHTTGLTQQIQSSSNRRKSRLKVSFR